MNGLPRRGSAPSVRRASIAAFMLLTLAASGAAGVLRVGPGRPLTLPSQAAAVVQDGDTVEIDAGPYVDCATWTRNNLTLRGVGGFAHVRDRACGGKAVWVIQGAGTTVEWIEFSGASVPDRNGAGIRQEGPDLTVRHCFFHDNEDGILAGDNPNSSILIEDSEFARNGYGDGYSHNMYINHVRDFTIRFCYIHHAKIGHNIKSRAFATTILCNRISDEADGTASRDIDLPNGGVAIVAGNVIQHGRNTQNSNTLGYGLEGLTNPSRALFVACNTFVNERASGTFVMIPSGGTDTVKLVDNIFAGAGAVLAGMPAVLDSAANLASGNVSAAGFISAATYDYHLRAGSPAIDAGTDPGTARGLALLPSFQYVHPADGMPRPIAGPPDIGAYEYSAATAVDAVPAPFHPALEQNHPNPCASSTSIAFTIPRAGHVRLEIVSAAGETVRVVDGDFPAGRTGARLDVATLPRGVYVARLSTRWGDAARVMLVQ